MNKITYFFRRFIILTAVSVIGLFAHIAAGQQDATATYDTYRLSIRDQLEFSVYDEPDLTASQRIDGRGQIRVPLLGTMQVVGMTIRDAEKFIQEAYIENRLLRSPMVTIRVADYAPKEVAVLGAVSTPGKLTFPIEANSLDIVDVISQMGGFTDMARSENVRVTRVTDGGRKIDFTVNVERMITGRGRESGSSIEVLPGDIIWVPQRIF